MCTKYAFKFKTKFQQTWLPFESVPTNIVDRSATYGLQNHTWESLSHSSPIYLASLHSYVETLTQVTNLCQLWSNRYP